MMALGQQFMDEGSRALQRPATPTGSLRLGVEARRSAVPVRGTFCAASGRSRQVQECRLTNKIERTPAAFVRPRQPYASSLRWTSLARWPGIADFVARCATRKFMELSDIQRAYHSPGGAIALSPGREPRVGEFRNHSPGGATGTFTH
jgi:hypothetical protein